MPSVLDPIPSIPTPATPAAPTGQPAFREFGDHANTRKLIFDNVLSATQGFEPVTNQRHTLRLSNVAYAGPETYSLADQKRAILARQTLGRELRGTLSLYDNATGNEIAKRTTRLAMIPYLTDRGTFINRGNEYTIAHQMRLRAGAFTRQQQNGELETHVNVLPGKGLSHHIFMDPATGIFRVGMSQARIPLYPLMKAMGITDGQLREVWGNELTAKNMAKHDPQAIKKLYAKLARGKPDTDEQTMREAVVKAFGAMELDEEVTKRTLGKAIKHLDGDALLAITQKLLAVNRGEQEPDDRDHLAFQTLVGPEDVFAERIKKARSVARNLLWKASARGHLDSTPTGVFDDAVMDGLMNSGLGMPLEEINPADVFDQQGRVTRMGEGGIPSMDAVPDEARAVQPSQLGFIDFLRTPESGKVGVDLRIARGARKGADGRFYTKVLDAQSGEEVWKTPQDVAEAAVAFPGAMKLIQAGKRFIPALKDGRVQMIKSDNVNFILPDMESTFSPLGNMVPMKSMVKGQRAVMAARMMTQALPVVDPEAPFVQSGMPGEDYRSFEDEYGRHMAASRWSGQEPATVVAAEPGKIVLKTSSGKQEEVPIYDNFPFNRKTFIHQTPVVQVGQVVQPGDLIARSNFTDDKGTTALGKNARVAYMAYDGRNFEDAFVISKSFAKRFSSEHMYQHGQEWEDTHKKGKNAFVSIFPSKYDKKMLERFGDDGIIKQGTEVHFGDPLILAVKERQHSATQVHRGRKPTWVDDTITWKHHQPGVVTDVHSDGKGTSVIVKSVAEMQVGDKMSGRYGDKGVVGAIIDDEQMPADKDGKPFEVLVNPYGVISRTNPAQMVENALGKIAAITGKAYKMKDFEDIDDAVEFAIGELRKHGLDDLEDVFDSDTGRRISNIATGNRWFMKLHHTAEGKAQGRGLGAYTSEGVPAKGGDEGAKRIGMLELNALLSHGATDVVRDAKLIRGQASPEYWTQVMGGFNPPLPKIPHQYTKFINYLKGGGINPVRDGQRVHLMALRDKDINEMAENREIMNAETVDWKAGLKPKKGGLFDESLTGGHGGNRWSFIRLAEPMPNPVMEEPIRHMLGITKNKFRDILSGKEKLNGITGPKAIGQALNQINIPRELERARTEIKSGKASARDGAIRRLKLLKNAERLGMHPSEWMLSKAPVLPPAFRPVSTMGPKKLPLVADPNYLYKELFDANSSLRDMAEQLGDDVGDERLATYQALKGVTGLGDPIHPKNKERQVKGILKHVFGSSPKVGMVQRQLLGTAVDLVGRSVITPNPDLDMDQVSVPEDKAWDIYRPFVVRSLVRRGMPRLQAARAAEERSPTAREALVQEMGSRPVIINRAPTLHRYGVMAAWPRLTKNDTLEVSPLVVKGFNADFDGDAMNYHVPATDEAAREAAEKMLPSNNLFSAANFKAHYGPSQEYVGGLYEASSRVDTKNRPRVFATTHDALRAYRRGEISVDRPIEIIND